MKPLIFAIGVLVLTIAACEPPVLPENSQCTMAAGLICTEFAIEDGQLMLLLQNGLGREIDIEQVRYEPRDESHPGCVQTDIGAVRNGATATVRFDETCEVVHDTWYDLEVQYSHPQIESSLPARTMAGELYVAS